MYFYHTALSVTDLEKSAAFYQKVFNLEFKTKMQRPEDNLKFYMLKDKNGIVIELIQHAKPSSRKDDIMDFRITGFKHIAFVVENIENIIEKAVDEGAKLLLPPKKGITVKRYAFISDPDGIPVELVEL